MRTPGTVPESLSDLAISPDLTAWFADAVQPHEVSLRRWLRFRFPTVEADDLVQESFLRVLRAHTTSPVEQPKAFLFRVAHNLAVNQIRRARHSHPEPLRDLDLSSVLDEGTDIPESVCRRQEQALLLEAIQSLPERARQAFTLRRFYQLSVKEIASRLNISEKTTEAHLTLALKRCADFVRNADRRVPAAHPQTVRFVSTEGEVRHA